MCWIPVLVSLVGAMVPTEFVRMSASVPKQDLLGEKPISQPDIMFLYEMEQTVDWTPVRNRMSFVTGGLSTIFDELALTNFLFPFTPSF